MWNPQVGSTAAIGYIDEQNILLVKLSDIKMGLEDTKKVLDEYCEKIYGKTKMATQLKSLERAAQMKGNTPAVLTVISNILDYAQSGDVENLKAMDQDEEDTMGLANPAFDWIEEFDKIKSSEKDGEVKLKTITHDLDKREKDGEQINVNRSGSNYGSWS